MPQRPAPFHAVLKNDPQMDVTVFLMANAVVAIRKGQKTPDGYYNIERILKRVIVDKGDRSRSSQPQAAASRPWR